MDELAWLLLIAAYSLALGWRVLRRIGCEFVTWAGRIAAATALGLGIVAYLVLGLGLLGQLRVPAVLASAAALAVFIHGPAVWRWLRPWHSVAGWLRSSEASPQFSSFPSSGLGTALSEALLPDCEAELRGSGFPSWSLGTRSLVW